MIFYFCPDLSLRSGGIRRIYRHVEILTRHDVRAAVLHVKPGFAAPDTPRVPIEYAERPGTLSAGDVVVIPEGVTNLMEMLKDKPLRRFVFALSWAYVFKSLAEGTTWRSLGIERVLAVSPFVKECIEWSMGLPVSLLEFSVDPALFHDAGSQKTPPRIAYFERKADGLEPLRKALHARKPAWLRQIDWCGLNDLTHEAWAREIRRSSVYLALGTEEALNLSVWEAMASGTLVAGYDGIGLAGVMVGDGPRRNCIRSQNGDYVTLARRLEPVLDAMLAGDLGAWSDLLGNARELVAPHTPAAEERSVIEFWRGAL